MSNTQLPDIFQQKLPGFLAKKTRQELAELNADAAGGIGTGAVSVNRISLKQSRFRLVVGGKETHVLPQNHLDVVVVRVNKGMNKSWYKKKWNPNDEPQAPDCYSEDGIRPHPASRDKQHGNCAECPMNQFGSSINPQTGAKGKACADTKRMSIIPAVQVDSDMYQLSVPAASLKDWAAYVRMLSTTNPPVPYNAVVTRVSFDTTQSFPKLLFAPVKYLTDREYEAVDARYDTEEAQLVSGAGLSGLPAETVATATAATENEKVQSAPQFEPEPEPEPARTRAAKPKATRAPEPEPEESNPFAGVDANNPFAAKAFEQAAEVEEPAHKPAKTASKASVTSVAGDKEIDDIFGSGWPSDS